MSFDVREKWSASRSGVESKDGRTGSKYDDIVFDVLALNGAFASAELAKYAPGVPVVGAPHPRDAFMRCTNKEASQIGPLHFEVIAHFEAQSFEPNKNPLDEPPNVEIFTITTEEEADEDAEGKALVTAVGEPVTGLRREITDLGVNVDKNIPIWAAPQYESYIVATNSASFLGFPKGMVKISNLRTRNINADNFSYAVLSAQFIVRKPYNTTPEKAWYWRFRHQGFYYKGFEILGVPIPVHAVDGNGERVTQPVLLKEDGTLETDPDNAHWIERPRYDEADFNNLNLGV